VSSQNGAIVQGKVANDEGDVPPGNNLENIVIDTSLKLPAVATETINWGGNLQSDSDLSRTQAIVVSGNIDSSDAGASTSNTKVYNIYGEEFQFVLTYTPTATPNEYDVTWDLYAADDKLLATSLANGGLTDTLGVATPALFDDADADGEMELSAASAALFDSANIGSTATLNEDLGEPLGKLNFTFDLTRVQNNNDTPTLSSSADGGRDLNLVSGSVTVFDSLGTAHQVTLSYTKVGDNEWAWHATVPGTSTDTGNPQHEVGTVKFNADGTLSAGNITPSDPTVTFTPSSGANPVEINLDFGSGFSGVTQTSSSSVVSALSQDGSASASLSNINIDQYGNIEGIFTNGNSRTLAQIMVATFPNLNGLISTGDNMYSAYANAGDPRISDLGEESSTTVQSGALEQSNVDLSEEFTKMIVSQRGFQANARVITTADTLLQEITNLIR
jgi:flagellar hook protein FlgE